MRESVHSEDNNDVNAVVGFHKIAELVFSDDFFWYVSDFHPDVFGAFKWSVEIEVGDVHGHEARSGGGNHTVEENLGSEHVGGGCCDLTGVVDPIATYNETCAVGFFLFWSYGAHELSISDVFDAILGNVSFAYEADSVGALYSAADAVCESSKFIG